jgi:hypothetical protein
MCITDRNDQRCGASGAACTPCNPCFKCSNAGACMVMPESQWAITCVSATIAATKPGGGAWDFGGPVIGPNVDGPAPDPVCQSILDKVPSTSTTALQDTFTPMWNQSVTPSDVKVTASVLMNANSRWSIAVKDHDPGLFDEAVCEVAPTLTSSDLEKGAVTFSRVDACDSLTIRLTCAQN